MESRIEQLIAKYWEGETSLDEEDEIKKYFKDNPSLTPAGRYFDVIIKKQISVSPKVLKHPAKQFQKTWISIAATVVIGFMVAFLVIRDAQKQQEFIIEDPKEAYEITRKALLMVSTSLNEGKAYSSELNKLNEVKKILND